MHPVRLTGSRTILREFFPDDVEPALDVVGDDRVTATLSFDSKDRDATTAMVDGIIARATLEARTEYYLAIAQPEDDRLIGFARLGLSGMKAGKLGYAVRHDKWRMGYATDAARTLIRFGFDRLGLHRISAAIGPDNTASIGMMAKLGFAHEGRLRDHVFTGNAWRDSLLYSILEPEWASSPSA